MLEAVIDQAGDDVAFLHDLSLICHALLPRARYHLFASILIKTVPKMKSSIEFLDSCPWVLPLVRNVSLSISLSKSDTISNICALDVVPVYFLSRLPNLRTWKMGLNGFEGIWKRELADLLLHRSALSCYQRYGSCIRSLELASTPFQLFSHFTGLVSSFTRLESLTCSRIWFRTRHGYEVSPPGSSKTTARAKPLRIKHLHVSMENLLVSRMCPTEAWHLQVGISSDFRAAEYLLESSQATLNNLTFTLDESRYSNFLGEASVLSRNRPRPNDIIRSVGKSTYWLFATVIADANNPVPRHLLGRPQYWRYVERSSPCNKDPPSNRSRPSKRCAGRVHAGSHCRSRISLSLWPWVARGMQSLGGGSPHLPPLSYLMLQPHRHAQGWKSRILVASRQTCIPEVGRSRAPHPHPSAPSEPGQPR